MKRKAAICESNVIRNVSNDLANVRTSNVFIMPIVDIYVCMFTFFNEYLLMQNDKLIIQYIVELNICSWNYNIHCNIKNGSFFTIPLRSTDVYCFVLR